MDQTGGKVLQFMLLKGGQQQESLSSFKLDHIKLNQLVRIVKSLNSKAFSKY